MKEFSCGDVVAGCMTVLKAPTEEEILGQVASHAKEAHGIAEPSPELVQQVRAKIRDAA